MPKTVPVKKDGTLDTISFDKITIATPKNKTSPSLPVAHESDTTDKMYPTRAAANTNKHIWKRNNNDDDQSGAEGNNADVYVTDRVVDQ